MKIRKRIFSLCLSLILLLGMMPITSLTASAATTYGDFIVNVSSGSAAVKTDEDENYLELTYGGTYEIYMASGVTTTDMPIRIIGNTQATTTISLYDVSIESEGSALAFLTGYERSSGSYQDMPVPIIPLPCNFSVQIL